MTLSNYFGRNYKGILLDYDYLLAKSDDECCYSLSEREIQILLALLDPIAWRTRYLPTETEINQEIITHWRANLARKLMSGCCPDGHLSRFTAEGVFQISEDGGETWTDAPEQDPRNDYIQSPPLPGEDSDSKRCAAADNVRDLFTQYRDNLSDLLDTSPTLVAIIAGILAFIAVITGVSGVAIGISVLLMGLAAGLLELSEGEIDEQIDTEALDEFRCLVYCRMNEAGQLTYDAWLGLLQDIAGAFSDFPELFFYQTVNAMGYIGINNAGTIGAATADDCGDCDCSDVCTNFSIGNISGSTAYGTYLGLFDGKQRYQSEAFSGVEHIVTIITDDEDTCCLLQSATLVSGSISGVSPTNHILCGSPQNAGSFVVGMPTGDCINYLGIDSTTAFVIDLEFVDC